jgi:hypothetical protein
VDAAVQNACSFSPTSGHVATASGGAGISSVFSGRHDDEGDAEEGQDRRRKPLLAAELVSDELLHRVQRDGENQGPHHQRQERRKDLIAKHDQRQDEAGADEQVHLRGRFGSRRFAIKFVLRGHGCDSNGRGRNRTRPFAPTFCDATFDCNRLAPSCRRFPAGSRPAYIGRRSVIPTWRYGGCDWHSD